MATDISDTNRWLRIKCPSLGDGQLILKGFSGEEAISSLFTFRLDLLSPREKITPSDLAPELLTLELDGRIARQPGGLLARVS